VPHAGALMRPPIPMAPKAPPPVLGRKCGGRALMTPGSSSAPPVPAALAPGLELGTWRAYRFGGVQNSLRAELVALREAITVSTDTRPLVVFTDCQSAIHLVDRFWRSPHTLSMHHELPLIEQIAEAIKARTNRVGIVKVPAHVGLHGNEVADSIAKWATDAASAASELGSHLVHLSDTDSVHPRGIGMACPWDVVSPSIRRAACVETLPPTQGVREPPFTCSIARPCSIAWHARSSKRHY
jgi:ribonuclease HI